MKKSYQGGVRLSDVRNQECLPMVELGLLGFLIKTEQRNLRNMFKINYIYRNSNYLKHRIQVF